MSRRASAATAKVAATTNSTNSPAPLPERTLIIDNGAYTIKAGFSSSLDPDTSQECHTIPNCLARSSRDNKTYIGSQLSTCTDFGEMQFKRPVQKGYIVNWPTEASIWENEFLSSSSPLSCDPHTTNLIVTEAPNAPTALQTNTDQIIFEEFEFASAYRTIAPTLNAWTNTAALFSDAPSNTSTTSQSLLPAECLFLIDSGHSHTTLTPLLNGQPIHPASKRINIGGKILSNYLSELISLRHFSLIDEPYIVDQIKQDCCFVSHQFPQDLESTWKGGLSDQYRPSFKPRNKNNKGGEEEEDGSIVVDYVLPDFETNKRGFMRSHNPSSKAKLARLGITSQHPDPLAAKEEVFPLGNERFVVPELLFSPQDIGMRESGIAETLMQCLALLPQQLWQPLLGNVVLVGGCALFDGFVQRVEQEVRALAPMDMVVRVRRADDPIKNTWLGGARLASERDLVKDLLVTRQDYLEYGHSWVARQFATRRVGGQK